jgi:hypothetical protein
MSSGGRNTLAPLRRDLMDGCALSPLSLACIAELEEVFGHDYGTRAFDQRATAAEALPVLVLLSLRRTHPTATLADAAALLTTAADAKALRRWLLMSIGYTFDAAPTTTRGDDRERPFNWWRVVRALRKRGLTYGDIGEMTLAQAVFELSPDKHPDEIAADDAEREAEQAARAAREARRVAKRHDGFDRTCAACGMTPEQFAALPLADVKRQIEAAWPDQVGKVNIDALPAFLAEYVEHKRREQSNDDTGTVSADADGAGGLSADGAAAGIARAGDLATCGG